MDDRKSISIVVPTYNEEANISLLRERLTAVFAQLTELDFEVVLVDDHSADRTTELVKAWADEDKRVRLIRLSRNCGSHTAIFAGLTQCRGDAAIFLAADLQDPPELIKEMLTRWRAGNDVVWAVRAAREGEKLHIKLFSRIYHMIITRAGLPESLSADFFLMDRKIIEACRRIPEKNTDFMFLVQWMGFRQTVLTYTKQARARGESKWTFAKRLKLFIDAIVSFSFTPIRAMSLIGTLFAVSGFSLALFIVVARITGYVTPGTGYAAVITVLLIGFGMIMVMLGIIGEYLWRAFDEARGRPRFFIEEQYPKRRPELEPPHDLLNGRHRVGEAVIVPTKSDRAERTD